MSPDLSFLALLIVKMAVTAAFVVMASVVTERVGPAIGALIATLPVSAGPGYVFLSLDHDAAFIAQAATASLAVNAGTGVYALVYAALAQRASQAISLGGGLASWLALVLAIRAADWGLTGAVLANAVVYAVCIPLGARFRHVKMALVTRRWYDVPLRAVMVATLVATLVSVSSRVGASVSGIIATFPIVFTSLMLILHPRIGGKATAAVVAHGLWGLVGFGLALTALHLAAEPLGTPAALCLGLAVSVTWNIVTWAWGRRRVAKPAVITPPPSPPSA